MASALIVFGTTTGNTGYVAEEVGRKLRSAGVDVTLKNAADVLPEGLAKGYDAVLFGCSTWGDSDIELQDDFFPLFGGLSHVGAEGKKAAVFGCGDSSYTHFCGAVDEIEKALETLGAKIIAGGLRIDGDPRSEKKNIDDWADEVALAVAEERPAQGGN